MIAPTLSISFTLAQGSCRSSLVGGAPFTIDQTASDICLFFGGQVDVKKQLIKDTGIRTYPIWPESWSEEQQMRHADYLSELYDEGQRSEFAFEFVKLIRAGNWNKYLEQAFFRIVAPFVEEKLTPHQELMARQGLVILRRYEELKIARVGKFESLTKLEEEFDITESTLKRRLKAARAHLKRRQKEELDLIALLDQIESDVDHLGA